MVRGSSERKMKRMKRLSNKIVNTKNENENSRSFHFSDEPKNKNVRKQNNGSV